jgi:Carbohydrate-selective porin
MKKGFIVCAAIIAVTAFLAGNALALTVEEEIAELKNSVAALQQGTSKSDLSQALGIKIEAGGTFILQGISKANDGSDKGRTDGSVTFDLGFGKEFENGGSAFMHIEGGAGEGLNGFYYDDVNDEDVSFVNTYSSLNGDAGSSESFMEVTELWYEQPLFDEKVTVTFGKLNAAGYFDDNAVANDETEQFLAAMFVNNTAIAMPDNSLGLRVTYSPLEKLDITYAYFNQNEGWGNIDCGGWNAIQATFKLSETGNYRVMYWGSNQEAFSHKDGKAASVYGIAFSLDQAVSETVSLFARYGYQNPEVSEISGSWSLGAQFGGSMWTRENDAIGVAVGQNMVSKDYVDSFKAQGEDYKDDSETQAEVYYKLGINDNIALTPVMQYVSKPMGGNTTEDNAIFTFGIRTQISF